MDWQNICRNLRTITKDHRASVGPPNGIQMTGNPYGFSKAQLNVLRILQLSNSDGWATGDPAYFAAQEPTLQHAAHRWQPCLTQPC
jgi:hypothetical protein